MDGAHWLVLTRLTNERAAGSLRETEKEAKETHEQVAKEREHYIEAVLVRIMKSRKTLLHNELIGQVIDSAKGMRRGGPVLISPDHEGCVRAGQSFADCGFAFCFPPPGRFKADPKMIKMRIESLIEKEYLQRSASNTYVRANGGLVNKDGPSGLLTSYRNRSIALV